MKEIEVEELLKRFMTGETSVEEETALAEYFREATDEDRPDSIPEEDWEAYREMFRMFEDGEAGRGRDAHAPRGYVVTTFLSQPSVKAGSWLTVITVAPPAAKALK